MTLRNVDSGCLRATTGAAFWTRAARLAVGLPALAIACADTTGAARPPDLPTDQQARSRVRPDPLEPLVIEWPASERAELEARLKSGLVVVRYDGHTMDVLRHCRLDGDYTFQTTSVHRDLIVIEDQDTLQARLPLGAARLSATLRQSGRLEVRLAVVGTFRTSSRQFLRTELDGECDGASHVVSSVAVGAFELKSGGSTQIQGGASIVNIGAGAQHGSSRQTLSSAGEVSSCERLTGEHAVPPDGCGALVRLGLAAIRRERVTHPVLPAPEVEPDAGLPAPVASAAPTPSGSSSATSLVDPGSSQPVAGVPIPGRRTPVDEPAPLRATASDRYLAADSDTRPAGASRTSPWVYAGAGTVLAVVIGLSVLAAVLKKDETEHRPAPTGGLGNTSLPLGFSW